MPAALKPPLQVGDYLILPLAYPPLPSYPTPTTHYLYLRPHAPKHPSPDDARSLFISNIPPDATTAHIRALFAHPTMGSTRIERVDFDDAPKLTQPTAPAAQPASKKRKRPPPTNEDPPLALPSTWDRPLHRSGSGAVAVFVDRPAMQLARKHASRAARSHAELIWGDGVPADVPALGSERYRAHLALRYPDPEALRASADAYMAALAAQESAGARATARARQVPDEDGFVTVGRGGRTGPARIEAAQAQARELEERAAKKSRDGFYRFQVRERRKEEAGRVRKGFEEGRRRVERMRAGRKAET